MDGGGYMRGNSMIMLAIIIVCCAVILRVAMRPRPVGGELFDTDFAYGFELYVEEGYAQGEPEHAVWRALDEQVKDAALLLCSGIESHREFNSISDIMLGAVPRMEYFPRIYLDAGDYCYRIDILNWDNYAGDAWAELPIRAELYGEPVLHVFRIDMSQKPEDKDAFVFARDYFGADSLNGEGGFGWYSTMPRESLGELLALAGAIGEQNAEVL